MKYFLFVAVFLLCSIVGVAQHISDNIILKNGTVSDFQTALLADEIVTFSTESMDAVVNWEAGMYVKKSNQLHADSLTITNGRGSNFSIDVNDFVSKSYTYYKRFFIDGDSSVYMKGYIIASNEDGTPFDSRDFLINVLPSTPRIQEAWFDINYDKEYNSFLPDSKFNFILSSGRIDEKITPIIFCTYINFIPGYTEGPEWGDYWNVELTPPTVSHSCEDIQYLGNNTIKAIGYLDWGVYFYIIVWNKFGSSRSQLYFSSDFVEPDTLDWLRQTEINYYEGLDDITEIDRDDMRLERVGNVIKFVGGTARTMAIYDINL